jgi:hypothetical protein
VPSPTALEQLDRRLEERSKKREVLDLVDLNSGWLNITGICGSEKCSCVAS